MEWLKDIPLFSDLSGTEIADVSAIVRLQRVPRLRHIFYEGDERTSVFLIRKGTVKVTKVDEEGREQIVSFLQPGDMFPHVGFFDDGPYPGTAEVMEDAVLGVVPIQEFEKLLARQPKIAMKVMRVLSRKILDLQQKLQDVTLQNTTERITHTLAHLTQQFGEDEGDGKVLSLKMTNRELANMVGTTRETVNRVLNDLKRQGLVDLRQEGIWVSAQLMQDES